MAQPPRKSPQKDKDRGAGSQLGEVVRYGGPDVGLYVAIATGAFGALAAGAPAAAVFGVAVLLVVGWLANKFLGAYIGVWTAKKNLTRLRTGRGEKILEKHKDKRIGGPSGKRNG